MIEHVLLQTLFAVIGTIGFCILFHVPTRHIPVCGIIGGLAWCLYQVLIGYGDWRIVAATFMAAALVGFLSDVASHIFKEAATVFVIPGILPLVPGAYIFYTMQALIRDDMSATGIHATETLKLAAATALGLLVVGAVTQVLRAIYHKTSDAIKDGTEVIKEHRHNMK